MDQDGTNSFLLAGAVKGTQYAWLYLKQMKSFVENLISIIFDLFQSSAMQLSQNTDIYIYF